MYLSNIIINKNYVILLAKIKKGHIHKLTWKILRNLKLIVNIK